MKTTVDLPDPLFVAAKKRAAEERRPLRDLIADGLRARLKGSKPRPARTIEWVTVRGGLPEGLDVSDREAMHAWFRGRR